MIIASDQGCIITRNAKEPDPGEVTCSSWLNQPTAQMYHISVDYRFPYWVHGAQQDSGAVAVCSRGKFAEISMRDWEPVGAGGESGYTAGDPLHPGIIYGGTGSRYNIALNMQVPGSTRRRPRAQARRLDAAAGALDGGSARAVLRQPVSSSRPPTAPRPGHSISAGPHASRSRHSGQPRRGRRRRQVDRNGSAA